MKKDKKNTNAPIISIPDDLHSIWEKAGALKPDTVVSEKETESALQNIWADVDATVENRKPGKIRYLVAAFVLIGASIGFLNFFSIQKVSLPGEISIIRLPDGSSVTLNGNSSVNYSLLFGLTNREIKLNGHAHFDVVSNEELPFIVESSQITTTVLGTVFEVEDWKNAKFTAPHVFVHEGNVEVQKDASIVNLIRNEEALLIDGELVELHSNEVKNDQSTDWNEFRVNFNNIPLYEFFERLSLQFNTTIELGESVNLDERVSGSYRFDTEISKIILDVTTVKNLSYQKTHNGFIIR